MKECRVNAPSAIAKVASGFDILGFALQSPSTELVVKENQTCKINYINNTGIDFPFEPERNMATTTINLFLENIESKKGFDIAIEKLVPAEKGLSSRISCAAAALAGVNAILDFPVKKKDLLGILVKSEQKWSGLMNADKLAPVLMGGFIMVKSYAPLEVVEVPSPDDLWISLNIPELKQVKRKETVAGNPGFSFSNIIDQWGSATGLVVGLKEENIDIIRNAFKELIPSIDTNMGLPFFSNLHHLAYANGAIGIGIASSGPTIFSLTDSKDNADRISEKLKRKITDNNIKSKTIVTKIDNMGIVVS